jgi:hypothetical protein
MQIQPRVLREGLITGLLGGSSVALWFLIVDAVAGVPLFTPTTLGAALFGVDADALAPGSALLLVAGYTVFHYAAFIAVGCLAAALLHLAEQQPEVLALLVVLFVIIEMGFYGLVAALNATRLLNGLEWYQIALGNLLASVLMGTYLWRAHPELRAGLDRALSH